jgi:ATP-dependent RNA helicase RhlE
MFSATFANEIRGLAKTIMNNPLEVSVSAPNTTAERVKQWVYPVDKIRKSALLRELVVQNDWQQVLVFSRTKHGANRLSEYLEKAGVNASAIHGNKSQGARTKALSGFKSGKIRVLVATDIAARGLDIAQLPQVVNFDLPNVPEDYVHRIGRTGRAGASGRAFSLVSADEIKQLNDIEQVIQRHITREYVDGFEPDHEVPASAPLRKPRTSGQGKTAGGRGRRDDKQPGPTSRGRSTEGHNRPRQKKRTGNSTR